MPQPDPQAVLRILLALGLAVWASVLVWTWVGTQLVSGKKVVPYERRRPVPWGGLEVALIFGVFLAAPLMAVRFGAAPFRVSLPRAKVEQPDGAEQAEKADQEKADQEKPPREATHPVEQLLRETHDVWYALLAGAMAVLVAPIVEELLFRLVLQGWLEKIELRHRRRWPAVLRLLPGAGPVLLTSLLFAAMHFRISEPRMKVDLVVFFLLCQAAADVTTLAVMVAVLGLGSGATLADMGLVARRFLGDVAVGLTACLAVTGPIYLLLIAAKLVVPKAISADPIPLVLLALALGTLYYRTHRIVPSIVLHMAFNATGLIMLALAS